jgi:GAF domain-containing protein
MSRKETPDPAEVRLARLGRLQALTAELSAAATPQEVAAIIFQRGLDLVGARVVTLYWEKAPGELEMVHALGVSEEWVQRYRRIGADTPLPSAEVYRTGQPVWLGTPEAMRERFPEAAALASAEGDSAWAAIPLVADRSRGALGLRFEASRPFDEEEREFLHAVARQCAQALERARLFETQTRLAARLASLQAITSELSGALTPREVAAVVLRHLLGLGARGGVVFSIATAGRLEPVFAHDADDLRDALLAAGSQAPQADALDAADALWLADPGAVAVRYPALEPIRRQHGDGAWGVVALRIEGRNVGVLVAAFPEARIPGAEDRTFVQALAQQGAQALERARLYEAQRLQAERLTHLHTATGSLSLASSVDEVAATALSAAGELGATAVEIRGFTAPGRPPVVARAGKAEGLDASAPAADVVESGKALWIESREELAARFPELAAARAEGTWAAVPLLTGGAPSGALVVAFAEPRRLELDERLFVRMLAMPCAAALERIRLGEAAAHERRAAEWLATLLEGALTAAPVGLALLDDAMRVVRTSERLARVVGVAQEAQRGKTPTELLPGFPGPALDDAFRRAVASGERVDQELSGETPATPGVTRRFALTWYPVRVAGQIVGMGVMVREIG